MTNKDKIVLIIKESLRFGSKTKYQYSVMFEKHRELCSIIHLKDLIKEKTKLFYNLDEESELYKSIYETAKQALIKLQAKECYNFHSAELLLRITNLETCFDKKLKSLGYKIIDISELKKEKEKLIEEESEPVGVELIQKKAKFISPKTTGKRFKSDNDKRKEIVNSLLNNQL